jgi:hypothetical protein
VDVLTKWGKFQLVKLVHYSTGIDTIGWIPLGEGAYLHVGSDSPVIQVVGIAELEMAGSNVLWLS